MPGHHGEGCSRYHAGKNELTTLQIVRLFHGKRSGNWKGRPCYMAKCCSHRDRTASLSITQDREGATFLKCFRGCTIDEIMGAKGLTIGDLFEAKREMTVDVRERLRDEDRLALLERRHGLAIMAQAVLPDERRYWAKVEQNISVEIEGLRRRIFPIEAARIRRESETQRIIRDYGFDELWSVIP